MKLLLNALQAGNRSGTGAYTEALVRTLPEMMNAGDLHVLWPSHLENPGNPCFWLPCRCTSRLGRLWADQVTARRTAKKLCPDVVHYPATFGPQFPVKNLVLTVHDLAFLREPGWFPADRAKYYKAAIGRSVKQAVRIIADSKATAQDIVTFLRYPEDRVDVVPLGIDANMARADTAAQEVARAKYNVPEKFFLYLGTLEPRKNLVRLIEAFSASAGDHDIDLVIAGRRGWKFGPIFEAAEASHARARIRFVDFVAAADKVALLSAARAFVWPTLWEGFGLPPLEAMACGTPVLTSNCSSLPEVVGEHALQVDPEDVDAIAGGMLRLAKDDALCARLANEGPAHAAAFTWERTARATLDVYRRVGEQ